MSFFTGTPGRYRQLSTLEARQQPLKNQLFGASQGAFQTAADYYRNLLGDDSSTFNALAAPEMRRFQQEIIPSLAEQFAGMGASGTRFGGFQNAAATAGADLAERLGAIRANLRQQAAQGLMGIGQAGLQPFVENVYEQRTPGFFENLAPAIGAGIGAFGGGGLSSLGASWLGGNMEKGSTKPYGNTHKHIASGQYAGPGY